MITLYFNACCQVMTGDCRFIASVLLDMMWKGYDQSLITADIPYQEDASCPDLVLHLVREHLNITFKGERGINDIHVIVGLVEGFTRQQRADVEQAI